MRKRYASFTVCSHVMSVLFGRPSVCPTQHCCVEWDFKPSSLCHSTKSGVNADTKPFEPQSEVVMLLCDAGILFYIAN